MFRVHSIGRKIIYPIGFYYAFFGWENFAISPGKVVVGGVGGGREDGGPCKLLLLLLQ